MPKSERPDLEPAKNTVHVVGRSRDGTLIVEDIDTDFLCQVTPIAELSD